MAIVVTTNEPKVADQASKADAAEETKVDSPASETDEASDETLDASDASDDSDESTEAEKDESDKEDERPKKKGGFQKRIERLNKQKSEALRELEYWRAEAQKGKAHQEEQPKREERKEATLEGRPKSEDFETHAEFIEALADWKYDQRKTQDEIKQKETQVKTEFQKSIETFQSKVKEFQKTHKDFEEALSDVDDIPMSMGVRETLLSSDVGPQVMYELAKDRELYERINALTPLAAARELGRIEARVTQALGSSKEEPKKQTKAPQPIKPVGGHASSGSKKSIFDPGLSFKEYEKLRMEQRKAREKSGY